MRDLKTDFCSTAANVRSRHELLLESIGVFKEEAEAYQLVTTLSWALPTAVVLGGAVDSLCAYLYMRYLHPWQEILFYEDENKRVLKTNPLISIRRMLFPFLPYDFIP